MSDYIRREDAIEAATKWAVKSGNLLQKRPIYEKIKETIRKNLAELPGLEVEIGPELGMNAPEEPEAAAEASAPAEENIPKAGQQAKKKGKGKK